MTLPARSLTALMLLAFSAAGGSAQDSDPSSTEGALFLLLPVGAQGVSLGRAVTAMPGPEAAFWNPAGLADVRQSRVVLLRGDHAVGTATAISLLAARPDVGTLGFSYLLLDVGDQDFRDVEGNVLGTISTRNHLGIASVAAQILDGLSVGLSVKMIQFRHACRGTLCPDAGTTATTYALDAGVLFTPSTRLPLRIGAMVAHVGPRLQVFTAEQADPLPARARVAIAYDALGSLLGDTRVGGWLSVEIQDRLQDLGAPSLFVGTEVTAGEGEALYLRAGYVVGDLDQENGARVGLGLRYERFDLSIAKSLAVSTLTGETEPVHVTFSIVFG